MDKIPVLRLNRFQSSLLLFHLRTKCGTRPIRYTKRSAQPSLVPLQKQALCSKPFTWYKTAMLESKSRTETRQIKGIHNFGKWQFPLFVLFQFSRRAVLYHVNGYNSYKGPIAPKALFLCENRSPIQYGFSCRHKRYPVQCEQGLSHVESPCLIH